MAADFQLVLYPGLGADARLFEPQRAVFPQLVVPSWIPPRKNESLPDYAARLAAGRDWNRDTPLILGGVSFGGMIACEMARHVQPDAVVLIASCRSAASLRGVFHSCSSLVPWLPVGTWSVAKCLAPVVVRAIRRYDPPQRRCLVAMFREMDSAFMHWTLSAILHWQAHPLTDMRVFQIHGGRDRLIPARRVEADALLADGGHLINLTHADAVNAFIARTAENMLRHRAPAGSA